jgi:hypothetical protein
MSHSSLTSCGGPETPPCLHRLKKKIIPVWVFRIKRGQMILDLPTGGLGLSGDHGFEREDRRMAAETDKVLETLEQWKKRVFAAFLLIVALQGATALILLDAEVVLNAWRASFGSVHAHAPMSTDDIKSGLTDGAKAVAYCPCRALPSKGAKTIKKTPNPPSLRQKPQLLHDSCAVDDPK